MTGLASITDWNTAQATLANNGAWLYGEDGTIIGRGPLTRDQERELEFSALDALMREVRS